MKHHVVLGGAGFIGSHLVESLLEDGDRVLVLDDFSTGQVENLPIGHERLRVELVDLTKDSNWTVIAIREFNGLVHRIWHLASPASPRAYQADRLRTLRLGTGTLDLALSFALLMKARLLFASTSEVYGDPRMHPQPEWYRGNVSPTGPRSCYDEAKRCGEAYCAAWAAVEGVEVRIARIFNTYGPGMQLDDGRVVTAFIKAALAGEPLKVFGDGTQTRSFCYIDDLVNGLRALMESSQDEPTNIGNPDGEITIGHLAVQVASEVNRARLAAGEEIVEVPVEMEPDPIGDDPSRRCPDITRARAMSWKPSVPLAEGLTRTIAHFKIAAESME